MGEYNLIWHDDSTAIPQRSHLFSFRFRRERKNVILFFKFIIISLSVLVLYNLRAKNLLFAFSCENLPLSHRCVDVFLFLRSEYFSIQQPTIRFIHSKIDNKTFASQSFAIRNELFENRKQQNTQIARSTHNIDRTKIRSRATAATESRKKTYTNSFYTNRYINRVAKSARTRNSSIVECEKRKQKQTTTIFFSSLVYLTKIGARDEKKRGFLFVCSFFCLS